MDRASRFPPPERSPPVLTTARRLTAGGRPLVPLLRRLRPGPRRPPAISGVTAVQNTSCSPLSFISGHHRSPPCSTQSRRFHPLLLAAPSTHLPPPSAAAARCHLRPVPIRALPTTTLSAMVGSPSSHQPAPSSTVLLRSPPPLLHFFRLLPQPRPTSHLRRRFPSQPTATSSSMSFSTSGRRAHLLLSDSKLLSDPSTVHKSATFPTSSAIFSPHITGCCPFQRLLPPPILPTTISSPPRSTACAELRPSPSSTQLTASPVSLLLPPPSSSQPKPPSPSSAFFSISGHLLRRPQSPLLHLSRRTPLHH